MGGSQSSQTQTNILNAITTTIQTYTTTINKTINKSTNEALNKLIQDNKTQLNASCNNTNSININNCDMTGGVLSINQNLTAACVNDMMGKISTSASWQQKFSSQLQSSFANTVKTNNSVIQAMDAKNILTKTDAKTDLGGAIANVMSTIGKSVDSMTGTNVSSGVITNITNEFKTAISNKTYTANDIENIIKNINNNTVIVNNTQGCNLSTDGLNSVNLDTCDFENAVTSLNQTASIKSLQSCTQGYLTNMLSNNTGILTALDAVSANTGITNNANNSLKANNDVAITKTSSGSLLGFLAGGFGLGAIGQIIMIIVIICVIAGIIVVVIKVMKSSKASKALKLSQSGVPDVSNLSATSDIATPPAELGESNLSKVPDVIKDIKGGRGLSNMPYLKSLGFGKSGLSKIPNLKV